MSVLSESIAKLDEQKVAEPELELQQGFDKAPPTPPPAIWGENNLPPVLISDIDYTISFPAPTREFMDFSKSEADAPNHKVLGAIKDWYSSTENPTIYFVTNRAVGWRDPTIRWLVKIFSPGDYRWSLRMRPANDFISAPWQIKELYLVHEIAQKYSVSQVWEDDTECIKMYLAYGLTVFDAKETWPR